MAETKNHEEPALQPKRKPDDITLDEPIDYPNKNLKLDSSDNPESFDAVKVEANAAEPNGDGDYGSEDESNGEAEAEADPKGKGVVRDDKGKGKLIVEEEEGDEDDDDDSDDDSSDGGSELEDGDSDLSDDPLAEVDLDNILPSRTRRRQVQPGVYIANDLPNADDDDDSDDSDAA